MFINTMGRILLYSLFRRKNLILWISASIFGTILIGSLLWQPVYEASSSVLLQGRSFDQLLFPEPQNGRQWTVLTNPKEEINSEIEIIRSRPVAEGTVRALELYVPGRVKGVDRGVSGMIRTVFKGVFGSIGSAVEFIRIKRPPSEEQAVEAATEDLIRNLKIDPSSESHVIRITHRSISPQLSADVANKVAEEYIRQRLVMNLNKGESSFYAEQMSMIEQELLLLQEQLAKVMNEEGIASFAEQNTALLKKYEIFDVSRVTLQKEIIARQSKVDSIRELRKKKSALLVPLPEIAKDPIIEDLENSLVNLRFQFLSLSQRYTNTSPQVVNARDQINQVEKQIRSQVDQYLEREEVELGKLKYEEQALAITLQELDRQIRRMPIIGITLARLQKQIDDKTAALSQLRNKYHDRIVGQAADSRLESVKIVSQASVPQGPVVPRIFVNAFLGLVLGVVVSLSTALILEYMDDSLKAPEDIERFLKLPLLGSVPELK